MSKGGGYISTRAASPFPLSGFFDVLLQGLAPDGGLFVPAHWPQGPVLDPARPYSAAAASILQSFAGADLTAEDCAALCASAYQSFAVPEVAPLRELDRGHYLLELFHGPTFAFKDIALQVLARLFDRAMGARGEKLTLIGATSGDTGSAAIAACAACRNVEIFILYPDGRPSEIQRLQMTTVDAPNVHALAVAGDFDECQRLVKALFADEAMRTRKYLSAVNSINWARIAMQSVYYALAAMRLPGADFIVPSGNFGNLYAGYVARRLGYPVGRLIAATNSNDALHRFFQSGALSARGTVPTLSPSMDIQIPSNLERYLFEVLGRDGRRLSSAMREARGRWDMEPAALDATRSIFASGAASDGETLRAMADYAERYDLLIDPHTGVAAAVAGKFPRTSAPRIILATAHAAKFPDAVITATGRTPEEPPAISALFEQPERITRLPADLNALRSYILSA